MSHKVLPSHRRWKMHEKIHQLKSIIQLHEKSKKWAKIKTGLVAAKNKQVIEQLSQNTRQMRVLLQNFKYGDPEAFRNVLRRDKEIEMICVGQSPGEAFETILQLIFTRRKEYDRIMFDIEKLKDKLFGLELEVQNLTQGIMEAKEEKKSSDVAYSESVAAEIEKVTTQKDAAAIVHASYGRLEKILRKESRYFTAVLEGLKLDMIVQCQCILRALEMGQMATEENFHLKKELSKLTMDAETKSTQQEKEMNMVSERLKKLEKAAAKIARSEGFSKTLNQNLLRTEQAYLNSMKDKVAALQDEFKVYTEIAHVVDPHQVFTRIEGMVRQKYRLARQLSINQLWKETEQKRRDHMDLLYENILHSGVEAITRHEEAIQDLMDKIKQCGEREAEMLHEIEKDTDIIQDIRFTLMHLYQLMKIVQVEGIDPTGEPSDTSSQAEFEEKLDFFHERKDYNAVDDVVLDPYISRIPYGNEENKYEPCPAPLYLDYDPIHMVDTMTIKMGAMLTQLTITEDDSPETIDEKLRIEDVHLDAFVKYMTSFFKGGETPEPIVPSEDTITDLAASKSKVPTNSEIKAISRKIVEINTARPKLDVGFQKKSHDCY